MIKHLRESKNEPNPRRYALLKNVRQRMPYDGLTNMHYTLQEVEELPTHIRLQVLIDEDTVNKASDLLFCIFLDFMSCKYFFHLSLLPFCSFK